MLRVRLSISSPNPVFVYLLDIQRGWDNEEPLWRKFPVPPGTYDLQVRVDGMEEWLPAGEGLVIQPGQTLQFDTGL
jgi:hypothetical protein